MLAHDRLDGLGCLVCVVEWNCRDVVVEDVRFDDAVKKVSTNEAELAIDCGCGATGEIPSVTFVVRQRRVGVLKEGNRNCNECQ